MMCVVEIKKKVGIRKRPNYSRSRLSFLFLWLSFGRRDVHVYGLVANLVTPKGSLYSTRDSTMLLFSRTGMLRAMRRCVQRVCIGRLLSGGRGTQPNHLFQLALSLLTLENRPRTTKNRRTRKQLRKFAPLLFDSESTSFKRRKKQPTGMHPKKN